MSDSSVPQPPMPPMPPQPVYPPQPSYAPQAPMGYAPQPPAAPSNGLAIAGMVLGILSIVFCLFWPVSLPLGIAAAHMGGIALKKAKAMGGAGKGMAMAGLITGILGVVFTVGFIAVVLAMIGNSVGNNYGAASNLSSLVPHLLPFV